MRLLPAQERDALLQVQERILCALPPRARGPSAATPHQRARARARADCSIECQRKDWKRHKEVCSRLAAAQSPAPTAAPVSRPQQRPVAKQRARAAPAWRPFEPIARVEAVAYGDGADIPIGGLVNCGALRADHTGAPRQQRSGPDPQPLCGGRQHVLHELRLAVLPPRAVPVALPAPEAARRSDLRRGGRVRALRPRGARRGLRHT